MSFDSVLNLKLQNKIAKPLLIELTDQELAIETSGDLISVPADKMITADKTVDKVTTELVVFASITIGQFVALCQQCKISPVSLTAVNHRAELTSLRFDVIVDDLQSANQQLAKYCQQNKLEAALIKNAPKLAIPGLVVMDMDSTTIQIECIDEIAVLAGVGEQVAEVTELAMQGKLDFSQSLRQRVAKLANAPESILEQVADNLPLMPGLETLIHELKKHNWKVAIASGGFTYFADLLKENLGLDAARANTLAIENGKLTGEVLGDIVDAQVKATTLTKLAEQFSIAQNQTVAMGDGANDLVMMEAAHLGVAYHAKPLVKEKADTNICHHGLDIMLHWLA